MDSIYSELILEHNKSKHNKHEVHEPDAIERGHNPNCGDDLTLQIKVKDGMIIDAGYLGTGCAISQASMSIMIDMVKGMSLEEAREKAQTFFKMIQGGELTDDEMESLEDAIAFESLNKMPARAKCGTLGWHCLDEGIKKINS